MILAQLRDYLRARGQASLRDLALHCDADPDAVRGMLELWMRRGLVSRQVPATSCAGGCARCDQATLEIYAWHEPGGNPGSTTQVLVKDLGCSGR